MSMHTLVIYDITDDNLRQSVSDACKRFGLVRVQKSAFLGLIPSSARKDLIVLLRRLLGESSGNIQVYVLCRADFSMRIEMGKSFEEAESEFLV